MKKPVPLLGRTIFINILLRIIALIVTSLAVVYLLSEVVGRELIFTIIIGIILLFIQIRGISAYIMRFNRSIVQFIDSIGRAREDDIKFRNADAGISDFELRINELLDDLGQSKLEGQKQKFLLKNAVDELDYGLMCVKNGSEIIFSNKAFRNIVKSSNIERMSDLESLDPELCSSLKKLSPDSPHIASLDNFKASLRCKEFLIGKDCISLYSIHDIQQEIDMNEIESWERLIKVLTHEIMNSLSPIISLSKSMQRSIGDSEKITEGLNAIENTGEGLINFISEYRKLSDLPPPEKEKFDAGNLFQYVEALFIDECTKRKVSFNTHIDNKPVTLYADRFQIEQVLVNLLKNSLEALGGQSDGKIELSAQSDKGIKELCVEDNGPGILKDNLDKIFIPFFSTKKKGMGIGLSLSKQIITNHNGTLSLHSAPEISTKFIIRLQDK